MTALVVLGRLAQFLGACILLGAPLVFRPLRSAPAQAWLFVRAAAVITLLAALAALALQTAVMAGDPAAAHDPQLIWTVLTATGFGHALGARALICTLVLAALSLRRPSWTLLAVLGGAAMTSFAWSGHGAADGGVHLGADIAHLLAAGVWLGALAAFLLMLLDARADASAAALLDLKGALERFSGIGSGVVAVLLLSGLVNGWYLVGPAHVRALFGDRYGQLLVAKVMLFATMLGMAALNRFHLTPGLARDLDSAGAPASLAALRRSLALETLLGVLVLAAVALLGVLEPLSAQ